ncbi:MAG TPA: hypothetical protein VD948_03390 [Rhodothermales bacterium]|nr:hypothetical protein [Rhodothermales bacterium]
MKRLLVTISSLFALTLAVSTQLGAAPAPTVQGDAGCKLVCYDGECCWVCD